MSSVLKMQNLMYNFYIFRAAMPFPYISKISLFTGINVTDFLKRFKDIAINYGLSDDRKV